MSKKKKILVAIDGPAGAGKTTAAKEISRAAGYSYVDTGAMYRALTLLSIRNNVDPESEEGLAELLQKHQITFKNHKIIIDQEEVEKEIRSQKVTQLVSTVCKHKKVREIMVNIQRGLAGEGGVVMEGRDIGTVVLPHAQLKIFLKASLEERAKRRKKDLDDSGENLTLDSLVHQIRNRDKKDSQREIAPLRKAPEAIVLDNTQLTIQEEIDFILRKIKELENNAESQK
ncbi:(d)CMP kinase [bacterium]|nr:(d)CMP kinase [bacterium]